MQPLLMPSDVKDDPNTAAAAAERAQQEAGVEEPIEPPSVKLIVRLFLIPLIIVAAAVGVMFLIGLLAGGEPSFEQALERLKNPGGGRTAEWLIGPGAKQRYIDAKTITDKMKQGMTTEERVSLTDSLIDILDNHVAEGEGEVRHFLLLALGRVWQSSAEEDAPGAAAARERAASALLRHAESEDVSTRKAAVLAMAYLSGQETETQVVPLLVRTVQDESQDLDVRLAAATVLGPIGSDDRNPQIIDALGYAMRDTDKRNIELVWASALSLAQMNQPEVADVVLQLLDREALAEFEYYDRESDPQNPSFRRLNEQEQQRILINTMLGVRNLDVPAVQDKLRELAQSDPSPRVREAGIEILGDGAKE